MNSPWRNGKRHERHRDLPIVLSHLALSGTFDGDNGNGVILSVDCISFHYAHILDIADDDDTKQVITDCEYRNLQKYHIFSIALPDRFLSRLEGTKCDC